MSEEKHLSLRILADRAAAAVLEPVERYREEHCGWESLFGKDCAHPHEDAIWELERAAERVRLVIAGTTIPAPAVTPEPLDNQNVADEKQ